MKKLGLLFVMLIVVSCSSKEEKMKKAEEEGNEIVAVKSKMIEGAGSALQTEGKAAVKSASKGIGEIVKGINTGFSESIKSAKVVSAPSFKQVFEDCTAEKMYESDSAKIKKVTVYLIAKKSFKGEITLKALNEANKEIGRSKAAVDMKKDDAKYVDFSFDVRTHLLQTESFEIKI